MGKSQENHPNQRALILTLTAAALETILCTVLLLRIPSGINNAFLFGFSKERLLMLSGFAIIFIINILALIFRDSYYTSFLSRPAAPRIFFITAAITLFFLLLPEYRFGKSEAYFIRIKPYLIWGFLTSSTYLLFFGYENRFRNIRDTLRNLLDNRSYILPVLAVLAAGILFIEISGLGKTPEDSLWNKNGIPLQSIQLYLLILAAFLCHRSALPSFAKKRSRLLHFLFIWVCSAVICTLSPMKPHFFAPGPYEPNLQYFPYSDAISYDIAVQTALNGWGFNMGSTILKPTLTFITFLMRLLCKNDFNLGMLLQSVLFSILPAIIFLFGTEIGGIGCGYFAAALSVLKEWNALNTHPVLTIHSRLTMSEYLMQIILAAFCYAIYRWMKKDGKEIFFAALAGGIVTLGMYTRFNFMAFLPAGILILLISYRKQFRAFLKPLFFFFLAVFLTSAPILIRNTVYTGEPFKELSYTIRNILVGRRFDINQTPETPSTETPVHTSETVEISTETPSLTLNSDFFQNSPAADQTQNFSENRTEDFNTGQSVQNFSNNNSNKYLTLFRSMINHGIHNITSSLLTLPMEPVFEDLDHLYRNDGDGLWQDGWQGQFTVKQWIMIGIWTIFLAASCGMILKYNGFPGFSFLYFWLVYSFSIGFSRSSGGRYVVPCNWIPMLLLAFGCILLINKGKITGMAENGEITESRFPVRKTVILLACFTAFFSLMFVFEKSMPENKKPSAMNDPNILKEKLMANTEIDWDLVETQIENGTMNLTYGIALYPRFYYYRIGEHGYYGSLGWKDYSRLAFQGINKENGEKLMLEYLLPHQIPIADFPHDSTYLALSCKTDNGYDDVLAVTIETPSGKTYSYIRDPLPEFACPVQEPVCIAIDNCY